MLSDSPKQDPPFQIPKSESEIKIPLGTSENGTLRQNFPPYEESVNTSEFNTDNVEETPCDFMYTPTSSVITPNYFKFN